jgi:Domain of unknown function (DUF6458)
MKTATGLTLVAIGAILAFAVNAHLRVLNLQVVGWVIILTGLAGIFVPRSAYGGLRRRVVYRRTPRAGAVRVAEDGPAPYIVDTSTPPIVPDVTGQFDIAEPAAPPPGSEIVDVPPPGSEIVEEYFEE